MVGDAVEMDNTKLEKNGYDADEGTDELDGSEDGKMVGDAVGSEDGEMVDDAIGGSGCGSSDGRAVG